MYHTHLNRVLDSLATNHIDNEGNQLSDPGRSNAWRSGGCTDNATGYVGLHFSAQFPPTDISPSRQEGLTLAAALDEALALHADLELERNASGPNARREMH
jgi:hypothetical protein